MHPIAGTAGQHSECLSRFWQQHALQHRCHQASCAACMALQAARTLLHTFAAKQQCKLRARARFSGSMPHLPSKSCLQATPPIVKHAAVAHLVANIQLAHILPLRYFGPLRQPAIAVLTVRPCTAGSLTQQLAICMDNGSLTCSLPPVIGKFATQSTCAHAAE